MIKSIKFRNFMSFYHEGEVNFAVSDEAPEIHHFKKCGSHRLSKVSAILGANGSGKSNVLYAISFLGRFIAHSFSKTSEGININSHEAQTDKPSFFEVEFYIEEQLYKFSLKLDQKRVLLETLEHYINQDMKMLYSREYDPSKKNDYTFEPAEDFEVKKDFIERVRPNASVISTGSQFNYDKCTQIKNYWGHIVFSPSSDVLEISKFYFQNKHYFDSAKEYLKKLDLGLSDIAIGKTEQKTSKDKIETIYLPFGLHKHKSSKFSIPFIWESLGTQKLYTILRMILPALDTGSFCFTDEIESSLHPEMLPFICDLFVSEESNPKGAQLLCTTHAPTLVSELSKYQIFLTEKNKDCESEIYRLDELEDIKPDDNLLGEYLAGAYGGVPEIDV